MDSDDKVEREKKILEEASSAARDLISEAAVKAASILEEASTHVVSVKVMANDLAYVRKDITEIKTQLESHYITKAEFQPVRNIAFGMVTVILLGVSGALIALVIK